MKYLSWAKHSETAETSALIVHEQDVINRKLWLKAKWLDGLTMQNI